ncbi:MAG TPA: homocysteine S-methyltransferase family protein [Phycisphaerae bacterium]|nr:homocysteine S-methyltransferase family protein [Phycisphaerae bacterium]HQL54292.1 homocysteine S-methyltransferase family protein [Phycisphaerae bacterium]
MTLPADVLTDRLRRGPLVLDGAMGTELERRGTGRPVPLWSAGALLDAPEVVAAIHAEYAAAGADILVANTFRTNPRALRAAGRLADGPRLNQLAVGLARRAAGAHNVIVAASVAPVEDCYCPERVPVESELRAEHRQMAAWLAAAKPDLIWIETIGKIREARAAAEAACACGLPFVASFVVQESGDLLGGEPLADAVAAIEPLGPGAVGLNCIPPRGLTRLLPRLRELTERPVCAYAHIGNRDPIPGWSCAQDASPTEYAVYAAGWLAAGAQIVGGCCGTTPAHIRAVRAVVNRRADRA